MKNKNFLYLLLILLLVGGWFYWTQIRIINIRKKCYTEAFVGSMGRLNEENDKWAEDKVWSWIDSRDGGYWGWSYPPTPKGSIGYKLCLMREGISTSL